MNLKEVHEVVNKFQRAVFKNASFIDSGFFTSSFKGSGLQFKEHQVYNYGDEVRFIDWKLLARKNIPYVKTFEEERNVDVKIIVDCSEGLIVSHNKKSKFESILEMCAVLILFAGKTKDTVSITLLGEKQIYLSNLSGENGLVRLISILNSEELIQPSGKPDIVNFYKFCLNRNDNGFKSLSSFKKGPFIVFSSFLNSRYDFFEKVFKGQNTHFFNLRCPFEKDIGKKRFMFTGLFHSNLFLDKELNQEKLKKIININLEKTPLVEFVEGIMSYATRI